MIHKKIDYSSGKGINDEIIKPKDNANSYDSESFWNGIRLSLDALYESSENGGHPLHPLRQNVMWEEFVAYVKFGMKTGRFAGSDVIKYIRDCMGNYEYGDFFSVKLNLVDNCLTENRLEPAEKIDSIQEGVADEIDKSLK